MSSTTGQLGEGRDGGSSGDKNTTTSAADTTSLSPRFIRIHMVCGSEDWPYRVKTTTKLGKLKEDWVRRHNVNPANVRFVFEGIRVLDEDTVQSREMRDDDEIEIFVKSDGGGFY